VKKKSISQSGLFRPHTVTALLLCAAACFILTGTLLAFFLPQAPSNSSQRTLTFEERVKGSIEPGKLADLVVLPEDILTCPAKKIERMAVTTTMVGGKIVYQRP